VSQEIQVDDYVVKGRPPHSYYNGPPKVIYKVLRLVRAQTMMCAQVSKCNFKTLTIVPGSKIFLIQIDRLTQLDPLEVMARWGKTGSLTSPSSE
jgi:hypothetical protein